MLRQAQHERNLKTAVHPEPVEGLVQFSINTIKHD